ncbi:chromatin associated protein KTI12 [Xylariaceae sp. FL0255]|nr:chromatin associated protein KTI12 [Xylariaceae sp. FL0255]
MTNNGSSFRQLIIISGFPTSGKSTRASQLHTYLTERIKTSTKKYRLHLISDQTLSIPRSVYDLSSVPAHVRSANASEKNARAAVFAAVKRVLSDRDIIILDGMNYIKSERYQLHCEAKAMRTPCCILQVGCTRERSQEVNEARLAKRASLMNNETDSGVGTKDTGEAEAPYEPANWENLVFRHEEPTGEKKYEKPLFTLIWEDDEARTKEVFDQLWDSIAGEARKNLIPNQATVQRGRSIADGEDNLIYLLERETQDVVKKILEQQGDEGGGEVRVSRGGGKEGDEELVVDLPSNKLGLPQLQRLQRTFINLNRGGIGLENIGNLGPSRIRENFVVYLNDSFEKDG